MTTTTTKYKHIVFTIDSDYEELVDEMTPDQCLTVVDHLERDIF